jgi:hypothetical protein
LKSWDIKPMSSKAGYKLVLTPGRAMKDVLTMTQRRQLAAAAQVEAPLSEPRERARVALIEQGVSQAKATELARTLDPAGILARVDYVAQQIAADRRHTIKNPAGYLITFVEGEQAIPAPFAAARTEAATHKPKPRENADSLVEMQLQEEYEGWRVNQADEAIADRYPGEQLTKRLREISSRLRKDREAAAMLERLTPEQRRRELLRYLRRDVLKELLLESFEEWRQTHLQAALF